VGFDLVSCKKGDAKTVISGDIQLTGAVFNHIEFIINTEGTAFTITTGKLIKLNSSWTLIIEGELKVTPRGMSTKTLNYDDGTCNLKAKVTIDDKDYEIILW